MHQKHSYRRILGIFLTLALLCCALPAGFTQAAAKKAGKVTLQSAKATSKSKIKLTWKKSGKANGYQIKVSKKKSGAGAVLNKTTTKTTLTTGKLGAGTYYAKVRAYLKSGSKKIYGTWSAVKIVKIAASNSSSSGGTNTDSSTSGSGS